MNEIADIPAAASFGALDRLLRSQLLARLDALDHGMLVVRDALGEHRFGRTGGDALPVVHLWIDDPSFYRAVAAQGSVGAGEAYKAIIAIHVSCQIVATMTNGPISRS